MYNFRSCYLSMGKLLGVDGERAAGKCHHPRGHGKILLRHMFLCRYVNPRVSLDGIDVFRVGHWGCFCRECRERGRKKERESERNRENGTHTILYCTSRRCNLYCWKSRTSSVVERTVCTVVHGYISRLRRNARRVSRCASLLLPRDLNATTTRR